MSPRSIAYAEARDARKVPTGKIVPMNKKTIAVVTLMGILLTSTSNSEASDTTTYTQTDYKIITRWFYNSCYESAKNRAPHARAICGCMAQVYITKLIALNITCDAELVKRTAELALTDNEINTCAAK